MKMNRLSGKVCLSCSITTQFHTVMYKQINLSCSTDDACREHKGNVVLFH